MSGTPILEPIQQWLDELARFAREIERLSSEVANLPPEAVEEERSARIAELADIMSDCAKASAKLSELLRLKINNQ